MPNTRTRLLILLPLAWLIAACGQTQLVPPGFHPAAPADLALPAPVLIQASVIVTRSGTAYSDLSGQPK